MVTIRIEDEEKDLQDATPQWIRRQLERFEAKAAICIRVTISVGSLQLNLVTPGCHAPPGFGQLDAQQQAIANVWRDLVYEAKPVHGKVWAFLQQLKTMLPAR